VAVVIAWSAQGRTQQLNSNVQLLNTASCALALSRPPSNHKYNSAQIILAWPPSSTLADDFDDNSIDTAKWNIGSLKTNSDTVGVTVSETNSRVECTPPGTSGRHYGGYVSASIFDFTNSSIFCKIAPSGAYSGSQEFYLAVGPDADNTYLALFDGGIIRLRQHLAGVESNVGTTFSYSSSTHAWMRLRSDATTVYIDTAPDSASNPPISGDWTNQISAARDSGINLAKSRVGFGVGSYAGVTGTTVYFDGFNTTATVAQIIISDLVVGSPTLDTPTLIQDHVIPIAALAVGSPVLSSPVLQQRHILTFNNLVSASPVFGGFAVTVNIVATFSNLTVVSPVLGSPTIIQRHVLAFNNLTVVSPVFGTPTLAQDHVLSFANLATVSPVLANPILIQRHVLSVSSLATSGLALDNPTIFQRHILSINGLVTSSPVLDQPTIAGAGAISVSSLATGSPVMGTPAILQRHMVAAVSFASASPALGTVAMVQNHQLAVNDNSVGPIVFGLPVIAQTYVLTAIDLTLGSPVLDRFHMSGGGIIAESVIAAVY
jgi:hypothetical protein